MDKKTGLKLGVCSLLVGLLALTACNKKTSKRKPTTKSGTTSKKGTSVKPSSTSKRTTTEDKNPIVRIDVYIGSQKVTDEFNTIEFTYGDNYDISSLIMVRGVRLNDTEDVITDYDINTDITSDSDAGSYVATISYKDLDSVALNVVINPKEVDVANLTWNYSDSYNYNGKAQSVELVNVPEGVNVTYFTNGVAGNSKTNAGMYTTSVEVTAKNSNYIVIN